MSALPVPKDLLIPTCDHCGSEWIDDAIAKALDEVLPRVYANEVHKRFIAALEKVLMTSDIPQRRIERLLGLSQGYLSRLKNDRGEPSPQVVSALTLLAQDPVHRLRELDQLWGPE
jgi:hypothetical protein